MTKSFMKELEADNVFGTSMPCQYCKKLNIFGQDKFYSKKRLKRTLSKKKEDILDEINSVKLTGYEINRHYVKGLIKSQQIIEKHLK